MDGFIKVEALTLGALFAGARRLRLPWFQRAYAWRTDHANRLLADILAAIAEEKPRYALGLIRVAQLAGQTEASLVDGHQRTITLTILFAVLRDLIRSENPEEARLLDEMIFTARGADQTTPARVQPQDNVAVFFHTFVQSPGSTEREPEGDIAGLNYGARNIFANRSALIETLAGLSAAERLRLARFLRERCWIVVMAVEDEDEAWAMLVNEESTGLDFHECERSKFTMISVMPPDAQQEAGRVWERAQSDLGSDALDELLHHIRTMTLNRRSNRPVERDLIERHSLQKNGRAFIAGPFAGNVARAIAISQRALGDARSGPAIAHALDMLAWLDDRFWMPPLLRWLDVRGAGHARTQQFVERLDRLAWVLKIAGVDPIDHERRMIRVMQDADTIDEPDQMPSLAIDQKYAAKFGARLRDRNFYLKSCSNLVLRRLSLIAGQLHGPVDGVHVSVEHILPRNPPRERRWHRDFEGAKLADHTNRLGNLVFLSQEDNLAAGDLDFEVKRPIFAASSFALAAAVARGHTSWTAASIMQRTEALVGSLAADMHMAPS